MASRTFGHMPWEMTWAAAGCRLLGRKARRQTRSAKRVIVDNWSWQGQAGMHDGRVEIGQ